MRATFPRTALAAGLLALTARAAPEPSHAAHSLAPGQPDFVDHRRTLEERLAEADAVEVALARVHNALAALLGATPPRPCESELGRSLLARSRPLGAAYRDTTQAARAEASRLRALLLAPTLTPLLLEEDRRAADALLQRTVLHAREYQEILAWQQHFVDPLIQRCAVALMPAEGLPGAGPLVDSSDEPVAVVGLGGGKICPGNLPADGRVLVLRSPKACYGGSSCACEQRPVLPGAVLGPPATAP
jgi:hypothetical protein